MTINNNHAFRLIVVNDKKSSNYRKSRSLTRRIDSQEIIIHFLYLKFTSIKSDYSLRTFVSI